MIGPHQVKLLIQLKLTQGVNNSFEYCNVFIPLPNRYREHSRTPSSPCFLADDCVISRYLDRDETKNQRKDINV